MRVCDWLGLCEWWAGCGRVSLAWSEGSNFWGVFIILFVRAGAGHLRRDHACGKARALKISPLIWSILTTSLSYNFKSVSIGSEILFDTRGFQSQCTEHVLVESGCQVMVLMPWNKLMTVSPKETCPFSRVSLAEKGRHQLQPY